MLPIYRFVVLPKDPRLCPGEDGLLLPQEAQRETCPRAKGSEGTRTSQQVWEDGGEMEMAKSAESCGRQGETRSRHVG